jgi:Holliday junction resolvase RusA-like endonuclease
MIKFSVPGEPRGKGRPRIARAGRFARMYPDERTEAYESFIRLAFRLAAPDFIPLTGPVALSLIAYCGVPKSASKRKRAAMLARELRPTRKPDLSNVQKAVEDGLNSVCFRDDALIVSVMAEKRYSDRPRLEIEIREISGEK